MNNQLVSILVAAYNVEDTLMRCLKSVAAQTYHNIEIIIIDDGSTDSTPLICDEFVASDDRAHVVHQANGGLSAVRNVGLDLAKGELVAFADGDDELMPTMIEELCHAMAETDSDIVYCDWFENEATTENKRVELETLSREQFMPLVLTDVITSHAWNKLYRKSVWAGVKFPLGRVAQDMAVMHRVFNNAMRVAHLKKPLYLYYAANPNNTSSRYAKKLKSSLDRAYAIGDRYEMALCNWPGVADEVFRQLAGFVISAYYKAAVTNDGAGSDLHDWILANRGQILGCEIGSKKKLLALVVGTPFESVAISLIRQFMDIK